MSMNTHHATLEFFQSAFDDHLTEDAAWGGIYENHAVLAVADGAPIRLRPVESLQPMLEKFPQYGDGLTPSGVAARLLRDTAAELGGFPHVTPADIALRANRRLADELATIYGELSADAVLKCEPHFTILAEDPRYLRLVLPAAAYAVARIDWRDNRLTVAQGADSVVFVIRRDGTTELVTPDQMAKHDNAARQAWFTQPEASAEHPFFRARGDNLGMEINRRNGLYHNYEGPDGEIDPAVGVSVLDGLPQMADYMFQTDLPLDDVQAVLLVSDGMFWPAKPGETPEGAQTRTNQMGERIMRDGLAAYVTAMHAEVQRFRDEGINPFQWIDDATGLLLRW